MKISTNAFRILFFAAIAVTVLSCKQSHNDTETEAIDTTAVTNDIEMNSSMPDTTATDGTATDTMQNNNGSQTPTEGVNPADNR